MGSAPSSKEREYFCMCKFYACLGMTMKGEMAAGGAMDTMYTDMKKCTTELYYTGNKITQAEYAKFYTCYYDVYKNFRKVQEGCYKDYVPKKGASCMTAPASSGAAQAMPAVFAVAAATIGHFLN